MLLAKEELVGWSDPAFTSNPRPGRVSIFRAQESRGKASAMSHRVASRPRLPRLPGSISLRGAKEPAKILMGQGKGEVVTMSLPFPVHSAGDAQTPRSLRKNMS